MHICGAKLQPQPHGDAARYMHHSVLLKVCHVFPEKGCLQVVLSPQDSTYISFLFVIADELCGAVRSLSYAGTATSYS